MKLILFAAVVMFKCSRLSSSAPADASTETNRNVSENDFVPNQAAFVAERAPSLSYVSDVDDLGRTGVVFQFRRSIKSDNTEIEARRRSALDKGFMRFGRAGSNIMRFGRSSGDEAEGPDDEVPERYRKNDQNLMRFGRANYMRFGRNYIDDSDPSDEYNDASEIEDLIDRPSLRNNLLRFGRASSESVSNEAPPSAENSNGNKKSGTDKNMMRFGRANVMRFGKRQNVMRFGKRGNMMRFGRAYENPIPSANQFVESRQIRGPNERNMLRLGRSSNIMRFGRNDKNIVRFGKRSGPQSMLTSTKIYCEDDDCVIQHASDQVAEDENGKSDHLRELFGNDKQGFVEYPIEKK